MSNKKTMTQRILDQNQQMIKTMLEFRQELINQREAIDQLIKYAHQHPNMPPPPEKTTQDLTEIIDELIPAQQKDFLTNRDTQYCADCAMDFNETK